METPSANPMGKLSMVQRYLSVNAGSDRTAVLALASGQDIGVPILLVGKGTGVEIDKGVGKVVTVDCREVFRATKKFTSDLVSE